jgi:hypothetical protein
MTDLSVMLDFFSPETDYVYTFCADCGTPLSVNNHATKRPLCEECRREAKRETEHKKYLRKTTFYARFGDPTVDLVYAVINHALEDRDWQRKFNPDGQPLDLVECGAREFIEDGGVELWLGVLGLNIRPSMSRAIREGTE